MVHAFQGAAADSGLGKTLEARMQRHQALVQARIARRVWQSAQQRYDRLVWKIVGKEQVRIGDRGTQCDRHVVGIRLINDRSGRF